MDKFRIGQKVRIINSTSFPQVIGEVVVITAAAQWFHNKRCSWYGYEVDLPKVWHPTEGRYFDFRPKEKYLEPVYDGDEKGSWDALAGIWSPLVIVTKEKQSG